MLKINTRKKLEKLMFIELFTQPIIYENNAAHQITINDSAGLFQEI